MSDPSPGMTDHAASERPYDLRDGLRRLATGLLRTSTGWRMPSTWRATGNLVLWLGLSLARAFIALDGLLVSALTGWTTETAIGLRASLVCRLADMVALDCRRLARGSGIRIAPPTLPDDDPAATASARQLALAQSPLGWRLPAEAIIRGLAASAVGAVAVAWWWATILLVALAVIRLPYGSMAHGYYPHPRPVLGFMLWPAHITTVGAIALIVFGIVAVLLWPALPRAAAIIDERLARALAVWVLGPSTEELTREVGRLSETRAQAVTAADAERRRIERDLHDGFQPQLVNIALNLGLARTRLASDPEGARDLLERAHEDAKHATEDLRNIVRGIHPSVLDERGLDAAFSALAAGSAVRLQIDVHLDRRPPRAVEGIAYFVVAEAVTNVNKHARAHTATVTVSEIGGALRVIVHDDGRGGARAEAGGGLAGLADRLAGVDGTFSIASPAGGPTWIEARIPCGR